MVGEPRGTSAVRPRGLRADARRNRERLLDAARDAIVEHGADVPLDDIARRAGVGIATLYRRFPDRPALFREVALDLMRRSGHEARTALAEEPHAFEALARYLHRALDLRIAAVMPVLAGQLRTDEELKGARRASMEQLAQIISTAHADGSLRPDVTAGDIGMLLVRLTRPLPGPFPAAVNRRLAHRHLGLLVDGLRHGAASGGPASGPALTLDELAAMAQGPDPADRPPAQGDPL